MNKKLLPLVVALAAAGCSFIPEYQRPVAPVPVQWSGNLGAGGTAADGSAANMGTALAVPTTENWRTFFTDARLQELIVAALEHNRDLRVAVAQVEEARAQAGLARADRFPTVNTGLQQQAASVPGDLNSTGEQLISRRFDANLGVSAFELDFWGRVKSLDAAALASFLASDYAQQAFRLSLIADVAGAYYSLLELDARLTIADETAQSRAASRTLIAKRRDVGLAGDLDYLAADGAWQNARAEAANLARQRSAAANALRLLIGADVASAVRPASTLAGTIPLPVIAAGLPSEVLLRRPDVLAAEQKLIAANANIGAARAAFLPRIALTATAGSASSTLSGLFGSGSGAWMFLPVLSWPLFDAGRTASNVDLAEARKNIAVANYEKTLQQAFREVADLLEARRRYAEQVDALDAATTAQRERLQRVDARYAAGVSSYLELLDAQRELFSAQQSALAARRVLASTSASLFKALGGA
jgi:multidrug efflux system outer membrane protein